MLCITYAPQKSSLSQQPTCQFWHFSPMAHFYPSHTYSFHPYTVTAIVFAVLPVSPLLPDPPDPTQTAGRRCNRCGSSKKKKESVCKLETHTTHFYWHTHTRTRTHARTHTHTHFLYHTLLPPAPLPHWGVLMLKKCDLVALFRHTTSST